jgi:hypothetical protein
MVKVDYDGRLKFFLKEILGRLWEGSGKALGRLWGGSGETPGRAVSRNFLETHPLLML